jgi:UDP-2,3-diacylglucosamine pyrophosphatase LpxH
MAVAEISRILPVCEEEGLTNSYLTTLNIKPDAGDIYVISDLHLAAGLERDSKYSGTENFFYDDLFLRFIRQILSGNKFCWLVINGDFIDFLRIVKIPAEKEEFELWQDQLIKVGINKTLNELKNSILPREVEYGLKTDDYKSVWRLICTSRGHLSFFEAIAEWIIAGNKLVIVKGNHDLEWYWEAARNTMRCIIAEKIALIPGKAIDNVLIDYVFPNLLFTDHSVTFNDTIYVEHGQQYDKYSHVKGGPLMPNKSELNIPFGSFLNRYLLNKLEAVFPYLDNVRPREKILALLLRDHLPLGIRVFFRYIPFMVKLIPKGYFSYMFGKLLAFAVPLLVLIIWIGISIWIGIKSGDVNMPELKGWMITPLKTLAWAIISYFFVKIAAWFQLNEPGDLNVEAKKIIDDHPEYKFVIFGHTHNPEQFESGGSWFFNTGTWIPIVEVSNAEIRWDKTFSFVHLSLDSAGHYKTTGLQRWNDDSGRIEKLVLINRKN